MISALTIYSNGVGYFYSNGRMVVSMTCSKRKFNEYKKIWMETENVS